MLQSLLKRAVFLHSQVAADDAEVDGDFPDQGAQILRQSVEAVQVQVGYEENGILVECGRQILELKNDVVPADAQGIVLSLVVDAEKPENRAHDDMVA